MYTTNTRALCHALEVAQHTARAFVLALQKCKTLTANPRDYDGFIQTAENLEWLVEQDRLEILEIESLQPPY